MHTTNLRKVGGSVMLSVPPAILDLLHLQVGATVGLDVEQGRLVISPMAKPRYTLDELLAQGKSEEPLSDADRTWLNLGPVGREL